MSRIQILTSKTQFSCTGAFVALNGGVTAYYKSFTLQASFNNTGLVTLSDVLGNPILELTAGLAATVLGDNMDNGTAAKVNIAEVYAKSTVVGDKINISVDDGI